MQAWPPSRNERSGTQSICFWQEFFPVLLGITNSMRGRLRRPLDTGLRYIRVYTSHQSSKYSKWSFWKSDLGTGDFIWLSPDTLLVQDQVFGGTDPDSSRNQSGLCWDQSGIRWVKLTDELYIPPDSEGTFWDPARLKQEFTRVTSLDWYISI